jgi:hypothetical protein
MIGALDICNGKRLLGSLSNGAVVTFKGRLVTLTTVINIPRLRGSTACCTVAFASQSTVPILLGKQILLRSTLDDYQVPLKFKVKCMRVCDDLE